jgi:hypothetical protein
MNFTSSISEPFCEGRILGIPEYLNSFSSLFISLVAYAGLQTKNLNEDIKMIYFILFLNGFFSMGFHWTMYYGWKNLDQVTMIMCIWFGLKVTLNMCRFRSNIPLYLLHLSNIIILVLSVCEYDSFFRLSFTIESLLLIYVYNVLTYKLFYKDYYGFGKRGLVISMAAGVFWGLTELFCNKYLIIGHSVWHLCISYGMHLLLQFVNTISIVLPTTTRQLYTLHIKRIFRFIPVLDENYV